MSPRHRDTPFTACCRNSARLPGRVWIGAGLCWLAACVAAAQDEGLRAARVIEQQFVDVIARCEGAVVSISTVAPVAGGDRPGLNALRRPRPLDRPVDLTAQPHSFGSGVVIASDREDDARFVLTNYHVLAPDAATGSTPPRESLIVRLSNQRTVRASVIAADPRSDLAVLRLDLAASGIDPAEVTPIPLGDASNIRKGHMVLALGNPYAVARDGSASASWGLVSNISRRAAGEPSPETEAAGTIHQFGTLLHVDTRLALGTSGGALVNLDGELIGLTTALAALEGYEQSVGFAIPVDAAMRRIIGTLLEGFEVEYGFLGIQPGDVRPEELQVYGTPTDQVAAARVMFVSAASPAERGGLRTDDLILKINGQPVLGADDLMREIGLLGAGAIARIDLWRPARKITVQAEVTLGKWPVGDDSRIVATSRRFPAWRGIDVDYPTSRRRFLTSDVMERYHRAVLVLDVAEGSAAQAAGLRPGDFITRVDGIPVETPAEFHAAVAGRSEVITLTRLDGTMVSVAPATEK